MRHSDRSFNKYELMLIEDLCGTVGEEGSFVALSEDWCFEVEII